ncbi:heme exporter protein CcmD [Ignatzschineria sp. RMDPL8A]|uniref:heme exporter protein CcmD n=1 Tax=Ignatzschineria sp. RMDPL8A TaxID=2999236 RepID=UPI00169C5785|nr:heme exporter protein CcmD [Ignatzschineria sp. RMDPL8A]MDG9729357.1 heme exporter protein CcmD [Ignatzschineria sp. RMDPL8A]NLD09531.1 heme exporter protein CcmD [Xanthomonadaceae bacterium]
MEFAFNSFAEFLQMGKHGLYVWLSYGFFALCLLGLIVPLIIERKQLKKELKQEGL